jgi:hypothetical protein
MEQLAQTRATPGRTFRRSPGFALAAVFSLVLGIGANTAVFTLLDGALAGFARGASPSGRGGGVPCAYLLSRYVSSELFGVRPTDPWTCAAAIAILAASEFN